MNKFAVITGASRGLGFAVAEFLAQRNYDLALIARNEEGLHQAKQKLQAINSDINISTDAIDLAHHELAYNRVSQRVKEAGRIDFLFNNAGVYILGSDEMSLEAYETMLQVNVLGMFAVAKACGEVMEQQQSGYIMNLSSMSGRRGLAGNAGYASTKFAVSGFSEALFKKYVPKGVRVTALCPSVVATAMTDILPMDVANKIQVNDIVKTVSYLLDLSPQAVVPFIEIHCAALV